MRRSSWLSLRVRNVKVATGALRLIASTAGVIGGTGEIFGGGLALGFAGLMIGAYGILSMLYLALCGLVCRAVTMKFLTETAPRLRR